MALSKAQQVAWSRVLTPGAGGQGIRLTEEHLKYLVARVAFDLGDKVTASTLTKAEIPELYETTLESCRIPTEDTQAVVAYEQLITKNADCEIYFDCLARLLKSRLKYSVILSSQPFPTMEQIGPRSMLQFGSLDSRALLSFMVWRKWFFDIDNRAGQETGLLFQPIVANALGGVPVSASSSPVRRSSDSRKGRQIDCLLDKDAYEIKIRVTIAASGQGRWREELDYPVDCENSGYVPVLVCLDGTQNHRLSELIGQFNKHGGRAYVGNEAWSHLESVAGPTMSVFLEKYVRRPIQTMIDLPPELADLKATCDGPHLRIHLGSEELNIKRSSQQLPVEDTEDEIPEELF